MVHNCSNFEWSLFFLAINPTIEVIDLSKGAGTRFHTTELVWNMCQISWKLYVKSKKDNSQFLADFHVRATCQDWRSLFSYIGFLKKKKSSSFSLFFCCSTRKTIIAVWFENYLKKFYMFTRMFVPSKCCKDTNCLHNAYSLSWWNNLIDDSMVPI